MINLYLLTRGMSAGGPSVSALFLRCLHTYDTVKRCSTTWHKFPMHTTDHGLVYTMHACFAFTTVDKADDYLRWFFTFSRSTAKQGHRDTSALREAEEVALCCKFVCMHHMKQFWHNFSQQRYHFVQKICKRVKFHVLIAGSIQRIIIHVTTVSVEACDD